MTIIKEKKFFSILNRDKNNYQFLVTNNAAAEELVYNEVFFTTKTFHV